MSAPAATAENLPAWLDYIGSVHFAEMELGLGRVQTVARRLDCVTPAKTVITVAGTNGKGSVVSCLEAILVAAGISTGTYTSPHIQAFNERIRINQCQANDEQIVRALASIERARGETSLSYFEFATLAALLLIKAAETEVAILEVGLGGRLDAVNLVDPHISVITSIDLDHQEWLGEDRESIAREKAGILRQGRPLVCADPEPPAILRDRSRALHCPAYWINQQFSFVQEQGGWHWQGTDSEGVETALSGQTQPALAAANVACALQVLQLLDQPVPDSAKQRVVSELIVPGRQEWRIDRLTGRKVMLDVAHNPAATSLLAEALRQWRHNQPPGAEVIVVMAVMADKDIQDMARNLESSTDIWYIAELAVPRGLQLAKFQQSLENDGFQPALVPCGSVIEAYETACQRASELDLVLVSGSFLTVGEVRSLTTPLQGLHAQVVS